MEKKFKKIKKLIRSIEGYNNGDEVWITTVHKGKTIDLGLYVYGAEVFVLEDELDSPIECYDYILKNIENELKNGNWEFGSRVIK